MKRISIVKIQQVKDGSIPYETKACSSPQVVVGLLRKYLAGVDREHFGVICLNSKNEINNITTCSIGTIDECPVYSREIFKTAILSNSASIILFHNHPSGHPAASHQDRKLTKRSQDGGELLGVKIHDHIIIGDSGYFSFSEEGIL